FSVGMGPEGVALGRQRLAIGGVVVDLAIERDPDGPVLIAHRLSPRLTQVDDAQTPVAENDALVGALIDAKGVRTPGLDRVAHATRDVAVVRQRGGEVEDAGNATHG